MVDRASYADACRVIFHKESIGDMEIALDLLGLKLTGRDLRPECGREEEKEDEALIEIDESLFGMPDDPILEYDDEQLEDDDIGGITSMISRLSSRRPPRRAEPSMVTYLLTPDESSDDDMYETMAPPDYSRIPKLPQQVQPLARTPDSEAWRVARLVVDWASRISRPGRIDLRECTRLAAKKVPILKVPRTRLSAPSSRPHILVEAGIRQGAFAEDVWQLLAAIQAIGIEVSTNLKAIENRLGCWYWLSHARSSPTLEPLELKGEKQWCIVIAGGSHATSANLAIWEAFVEQHLEHLRTAFVWLGDRIETKQGLGNVCRMSYRL